MNPRKHLTNAGKRHNAQIAGMLAMDIPLEMKSRHRRDAQWHDVRDSNIPKEELIALLLGRDPRYYLGASLFRRKLY